MLFSIATVDLTPDQEKEARTYQMAQLVMGPAASAPMMCSKACPAPFRNVCMLAKIGKEPIGQALPLGAKLCFTALPELVVRDRPDARRRF
jgi:hypothetical protein